MGPLSIEIPIASDRSQPSSRRIAPHVFFGPAVRDPLFPARDHASTSRASASWVSGPSGFEVFDMPEALRQRGWPRSSSRMRPSVKLASGARGSLGESAKVGARRQPASLGCPEKRATSAKEAALLRRLNLCGKSNPSHFATGFADTPASNLPCSTSDRIAGLDGGVGSGGATLAGLSPARAAKGL